MAATDGSYLPPVVIDILGSDRDLLDKIAEAKAALAGLDDDTATPQIKAESNVPQAAATTAAEMAAIDKMSASPTIKPNVDMSAALTAAAAARALGIGRSAIYSALNDPNSTLGGFKTGINRPEWGRLWQWRVPAEAVTRLQESGYTATQLEQLLARGGGGGGPGDTAILASLAAGGAGGGGGKGGGIGGLLGGIFGAMGWGKSNVPFLGGLAGFGSLLGLAGLGPEHAIMTGVGLAGSGIGALLGGGLLASGVLGTAGVGIGTDLAGIGQAAGDIKNVNSAVNNLQQAIFVYGKTSTQAQVAQAQLNYTLQSFSQVARPAVVAAQQQVAAFKSIFDLVSGPAEKIGAQIINQAIHVGEAFLPTVGKYAAMNMGIIQAQLQPFLTWMKGPGLAIFTDLEQEFSAHLPTAMHAGEQAIELIIKTIDTASHYTGGFITVLDNFFTKWNSPAEFARWQVEIGKLIGLWRDWSALVKIAAADIYQLFHADAGTGTAIVNTLTQMLTKLHAWEQSTTGQGQLHNLFEAHKKEVIALLQLLPGLVSTFGRLELAIAPALTTALADLITLFETLTKVPFLGPALEWGIAIGILTSKLNLIGTGTAVMAAIRGIGAALASAGASLAAFGAARDISSLSTLGGVLTGLGGKLSGVSGAASNAGFQVFRIGGQAEASAAVTGESMVGMLGPIGLAVGATVGLVAAWVHFEHHAPSAAANAAKGIQSINQWLSTMNTGTVLNLNEDLLNVNQTLTATVNAMKGMKPGSAALETAAGAATALYRAQGQLEGQAKTLAANTGILAKAFGISTTDAQNLAQQVGINLNRALRPGDVDIFAQAVTNSGVQFDRTAPKAANFANNISLASQKAVGAISGMNTQTNTLMQQYQATMGSGSIFAMAAFINAQQGGLSKVRQLAEDWGINIPKQYLNLLYGAMLPGGQISMAKLAEGIRGGTITVQQSLGSLNLMALGQLNKLQPIFYGTAVNAWRAFNAGSQSVNSPAVLAGIARAVVTHLNSQFGIKSPSTVFYAMGRNVMLGFAKGLQDHSALATAALGTMGGKVTGSVGAWISQALKITGAPAGWAGALAKMIQMESGGNPYAQNRTAAGIRAGGPEGILQTIPSTFGAYMLPGHGSIFNPVDNIIAAIRYIESRYGSPFNIPGVAGNGIYQGYASGTPFAPGGWAWVGERGPELMRMQGGEQVMSHKDSLASMGGTHVTVNVASQSDPHQISAEVSWATRRALAGLVR